MLTLARHRVLGLMAAAMLLTGCQYDSIVNQLRQDAAQNDSVAISFGNGVIDNPIRTRSSVSLLSQHTNTMGVWGWQTTQGGEVICLFNNKNVTYDPDLALWTYSPARYWEKGSSYRFYAYAPHGSSVPNAAVSINEETGRITIQNVILNGSNTMSTQAQPLPSGSFIDVDDTDWMIDRTGQIVPKEKIHSRVTFNMQHILTKFNVMVVADPDILSPDTNVVIDSLSIGEFISKGSFSQKLSHTPVVGVEADDTVCEWTIDSTSPRYTLQGTRGVNVTSTGCCIIESLLLPQDVTDDIYLRLYYSINTVGGRSEHFTYLLGLNDAFSEFRSANNYTLTLIIGAENEVITFDSGSTLWDSEPDWNAWF